MPAPPLDENALQYEPAWAFHVWLGPETEPQTRPYGSVWPDGPEGEAIEAELPDRFGDLFAPYAERARSWPPSSAPSGPRIPEAPWWTYLSWGGRETTYASANVSAETAAVMQLRTERRAASLVERLEASFGLVARVLKVAVVEIETGTGTLVGGRYSDLAWSDLRSEVAALWEATQTGAPSDIVLDLFDELADTWWLLASPWARQRSLLAWQLRERDLLLSDLADLDQAWLSYELAVNGPPRPAPRPWSSLKKWDSKAESEGGVLMRPEAQEDVHQLCRLVRSEAPERATCPWATRGDLLRDLALSRKDGRGARAADPGKVESEVRRVRRGLSQQRNGWLAPPFGAADEYEITGRLVARFRDLAAVMED